MNTYYLANKKRVVPIVSIIVVLLIGFLAYNLIINSRFRVVEYSPKNRGVIATGVPGFILDFNRELLSDVDYMKTLSDSHKHVRDIIINDKRMVILTKSTMDNEKYAFSVSNIRAKDGSVIQNISFDFTTKYKPFSSLSKKEQEVAGLLVAHQDELHPIIRILPHSTSNYALSSYFEEGEGGIDGETLVLLVKIYLSNADVKINKEAAISRYKQEAANYVSVAGFDLNKYTVEYEIIDNSY